MAEKDKNNFVVNDKTYVKKPEIHYSYKFQPYVKDLGGSPGKNITQEDRNKRLKHENNVNAVRNVVKGLNNTFGKAISGAAAFYGGGWVLNRLLHLNKPSTLGLFFGRYVLPANTADNVSDGVELIFDPSIEGAVDLGSGVVLGRFKDLSKPVRQVGELIGQGANINNMKKGGKMNMLEFLKNGSGIHIKKKNRGKFTDYCGGKVTSECIARGKASSNPAIRKRATFADNARHFKHRFGGLINKFLQGGAGWGLLASSVVNAGMLLYAANKLANAKKESAYANNKLNYQNLQELIVKDAIEKMNQEKKKWLEQYFSGQSLDNSWRSDAFTNYVLQLIINQKLVGAKNKLRLEDASAKAKAESEEADAMNSAFSDVIQNGLGTLFSNLGNKKITDNSVNSTNNLNINSNNFWDNPTIKNSLVTGDFWNNPTIANSLA